MGKSEYSMTQATQECEWLMTEHSGSLAHGERH